MEIWESISTIFNAAIPFIDNVPILRAILGIVLVFFIPGFAWSLVLFKEIDYLERGVLSIGLSIAIITLSVIACNVVLRIPISGTTALVIIFVLILIPIAIRYRKKFLKIKMIVRK